MHRNAPKTTLEPRGSTSGLVITLTEAADADAALRTLAADPRFTLGDRFGRSIAAVLEAPSDRAARDVYEWLADLPGVLRADVVYVHLAANDELPAEPSPGRANP